MRPMFMIAAGLLLLPGAAVAQMTPQTGPTTQPPPSTPPPMPNNPPADAEHATPPKPANWQGTDQEWARHVRTCTARHSDYDPATDQYRGSDGTMRTCPR